MSDEFNPYLRWFDISLDAQPPNHYVLLGLDLYESNMTAVEEATEQRLIFLQDVANGPYTKESQRLLNEVATARLCLTDAVKKEEYDRSLQQRLAKPIAVVMPPAVQYEAAQPTSTEFSPRPPQLPSQRTHPTNPIAEKPGLNIRIQENSPGPPLKTKSPTHGSAIGNVTAGDGTAKPSLFENPLIVRNLLIGGAAVSVLITVIAIAFFLSGSDSDDSTEVASSSSGLSAGRFDNVGTSKSAPRNLVTTKSRASSRFSQSKFTGPKGKNGGSLGKADQESDAAIGDIALNGLVLWLDAADRGKLELNQDRVKTWKDKSSQQNHASQAKPMNQPRFSPNAISGKPAVVLGKPTFFSLDNTKGLDLGGNFTIAMVAWSTKGVLLGKGLPHKRKTASAFSLFNGASRFRISQTKYFEAKEDDPAKWKVRIAVADQKSFWWYIDGRNELVTTEPHTISNSAPLVIGRRLDDASPSYATGAVAELLIYDRAVPEAERKQLEGYLTKKWLK